jgi:hypothetical protein
MVTQRTTFTMDTISSNLERFCDVHLGSRPSMLHRDPRSIVGVIRSRARASPPCDPAAAKVIAWDNRNGVKAERVIIAAGI